MTKGKCPEKYKITSFLKPLIVYNPVCPSSVDLYVIETARYFLTSIKEHLKTKKLYTVTTCHLMRTASVAVLMITFFHLRSCCDEI